MRVLLFPLLGLFYLAWGLWTFWREGPGVQGRPPLEWRMGAGFLGALGGWVMANLGYAPDAAHRVVGLPLPVCQLVNQAGTWTDQTSPWFLGSLVLDLLTFILLAGHLLRAVWPRFQAARTRHRA